MTAPRIGSLPFKGRAGVGMGLTPALRTRSENTPSPPNPPLEGEGFKNECVP